MYQSRMHFFWSSAQVTVLSREDTSASTFNLFLVIAFPATRTGHESVATSAALPPFALLYSPPTFLCSRSVLGWEAWRWRAPLRRGKGSRCGVKVRRGEFFFRKQLRKKALGDFFRGSSDNFVGVGSHRRVWRGKRPPKFSGKNMWRVDGEAVARQYLLMNQTPAKSAVACQTLAWQSLSGKQTAPKNPQIASSCSHCVASISLEILTVWPQDKQCKWYIHSIRHGFMKSGMLKYVKYQMHMEIFNV